MTIKEKINVFIQLGNHLKTMPPEELENLQVAARSENSWFDPDSVSSALYGIQLFLNPDSIEEFINQYNIRGNNKLIGVVLAGNIPAVGFHDVFCILLSGNIAVIKPSSKDTVIMTYLLDQLTRLSPGISAYFRLVDQLKGIDAVIATGSDNTSRYFEYYFGKYPNIIRKNRTSIGILSGTEGQEVLTKLGEDIFLYYGLGCRNVSKIYVPEGYDFKPLFAALEPYQSIIHHHKYHNNYDYNKAIYLVNKEHHLDNGFLLIKEDPQLVSPISVLFYETYTDLDNLKITIERQQHKIQCIVSENGHWSNSLTFGTAQCPTLNDYADGIDTMEFLTGL
ncbi:acyl-CoA reductase [Fulvivirga sp. M361]|uniref:acyl-CoA reductase n=1 Tax=Fulvivirga sp. M361 TaxID=2594266 RepID=UPI00117BA4B4|nr:acyl-CoA reductase [Fulvivirga sp. M361]TRX48273.1 acyl-CoA reductase [Fulvivirga sp. M361]